jgi:hypothetical protein
LSEIVFILGAGASKDAGAPLMADFLDKSRELHSANKTKPFAKDFECVFEAISDLQQVHSKAELDIHNIESVFAAFEMARVIKKLPGKSDEENSDAQMNSLLVSIRRLIFTTLEQTVLFPSEEGKVYPDQTYNFFAQLIYDLNSDLSQNRCSIITFNYDLALDHALYCNLCPANYCLFGTSEPDRPALLKLHGSLNWAQCSECELVIPWKMEDYLQQTHFSYYSGRTLVPLAVGSRLSSSGITCPSCNKNIKSAPVIVPPTWNKTEYHKSLSKVWQRAALELSDAENIFVSGYSLTETDSFFRYLFALGSVGQKLIKRFWVFDPSQEVHDRFLTLTGSAAKARFMFFNEPFSKAIGIIRRELNVNRKV